MNIVPCDNCPAHCCRKPNVDVTIVDAYRIAKALHLPVAAFTELLWLEDPEPSRRICLAQNNRYYRFRLKRLPDGEELRCVFLLGITPQRSICSIYDLRPEVCRAYPSYLEGGGVVATSGGKFCPEGAWSIEKMDVRRMRADWMLKLRLQALHDELIDGWNERVFAGGAKLTEGDFHGFIQSTCVEIEASEPEVFARPAVGTPFGDPDWPLERLRAIADGALRAIGWRTDETFVHCCPDLGRAPTPLPLAPPEEGGAVVAAAVAPAAADDAEHASDEEGATRSEAPAHDAAR